MKDICRKYMLASNGYCAQQLRCMSTPPDRYTHTEDQIEKNKKLVEGHKKFHRKDYAPASMTPHIPATSESLPLNPAEIAVFNGFPSEHQKRTVIIAPRPDKTMQSGQAHIHEWTITWKNRERWSNPLMGWTSNADPMSNVKLSFDSKEDAQDYAIKNGWKFETRGETSETTLAPDEWKVYNHNFLPKKIQNEALQAGPIKGQIQFENKEYGDSHWFMPLKYHGDGEVRQHGPKATNSDKQKNL